MLSENVRLEGSHHNLIKVLQDELQWIELEHYTKDPHFLPLLEAIQKLSHLDHTLTDFSKDLLSKFQELTNYVSQKLKLLIDVCIMEAHSMQMKALQIEKQLYKQRDRAESLQQLKESNQVSSNLYKKRLQEWEVAYESMRADYNDVVAKLEMELKRAKKESKEVKQTFLQVREDTEYDRIMLQNLQSEKITIAEKMENEIKNNETLAQELKLLSEKISESQRQINSSAAKLSQEERRVQRLQQELAEKDRLIAVLRQQEQLQNIDTKQYMQNIDQDKQKEQYINIEVTKQVSSISVFNLADEIEKQEPFQPSFDGVNSALFVHNSIQQAPSHQQVIINGSVIEQELQPSEPVRANSGRLAVPDYYFAHYLLTVQATKLKLGQQDLFPIDMSAYYSDMIKVGTPFHQWDEWIRARLFELSKKRI